MTELRQLTMRCRPCLIRSDVGQLSRQRSNPDLATQGFSVVNERPCGVHDGLIQGGSVSFAVRQVWKEGVPAPRGQRYQNRDMREGVGRSGSAADILFLVMVEFVSSRRAGRPVKLRDRGYLEVDRFHL